MSALMDRLFHRNRPHHRAAAPRRGAPELEWAADVAGEADEYAWFDAHCPRCGSKLTDVKWLRRTMGSAGISGSRQVGCPHCHQEVAYRPVGGDRVRLWMHTMPAGEKAPPEIEATVRPRG